MAEPIEYAYYLKELFPGSGPDVLQLLHATAENAHLLRSDFNTIRDWLEIAECQQQDALPALVALLFAALEEGSLCIEMSRDALARRLGDFVPAETASTWAERMLALLQLPDLARLIGSSPADDRPMVLHESRWLYFQKYLRAELELQRALQARLAQATEPLSANWPIIVRDVLRDQTMRFDAEQTLALGTALCQDFAIISGGPGTGKTSIVLTMLRCLLRANIAPERIALAAP